MTDSKENSGNGPFQLVETPAKSRDPNNAFVKIATEMAIVHNCLIRALNAIYMQADGVADRRGQPGGQQDIRDFLIYCQCWCDTLKHHHDIEEEVYFPAIDAFSGEKGLMNDNIKGHAAFSGGLDQLAQYVYNAEKDISLFSAKELKRMINIFAPAFMAHMVDEIPTLLELETYGNEEAALKMFQDTEAIIVASLDKYRSTPLLFKGHDKTFEGSIHSWPQVPFFVPYLIHYIYSRKYEGAWRFAPCSTWGEPLPLKM